MGRSAANVVGFRFPTAVVIVEVGRKELDVGRARFPGPGRGRLDVKIWLPDTARRSDAMFARPAASISTAGYTCAATASVPVGAAP